jgi:hypothetical protein
VFFEANEYVFEVPPQLDWIKFPKRVSDESQTDQIAANVFHISLELRPVLTGEYRVAAHSIVIREAEYLSLQDPAAASR